MTLPNNQRCRGDRGQVGGMEVLPFGFLVFVSLTLLLVNVWGVIDAKFAVTTAAREATRAFVESTTETEATRTATQRARETLDAYGRGDDRATVHSPVLADSFGRCARVTVRVTYDVPAIAIPFLGGFGSATTVESSHTEVVDPFRNGLDGVAQC
ncbi:MAG: hypothetical protein RIB98_06315 [Acidimicrobiales bacterium]